MLKKIIKLLIIGLLFQGCCGQKNLEVYNDVILGEWKVSREENTNSNGVELEVWRRPSYSFPPSRFRKKYTFYADNTLYYTRPGANDKPQVIRGKWEIISKKGSDLIKIEEESSPFVAEIVSLTSEKVVLKKHIE